MVTKLISTILSGLVSPITDIVVDIVKSYQERKMSEAELRVAVERAVAEKVSEVLKSEFENSADVIKAEITSEGWLQRNWRPIVALSFAFVLLFYAIITPIMVAWFGFAPVKVGDTLLGWAMQIIMVALTGYIGGRSVEKITKIIALTKR